MTDDATGDEAAEARLVQLIEAYGANPARWPRADHDWAVRLAAAAPLALRARLTGAERLDRVLDRAPTLSPRWPLEARILAAAPSLSPAMKRLALRRRFALSAGLAAACAAGLALGVFAAPLSFAPERPTGDFGAMAALLVGDPADTADG